MPPDDPLDQLPDSKRALLQLLAWLGSCDGTVAPEELKLLERLVARGCPAATALLPLVCNGAGGALEATQAETTYNQWWHLAAVLVLSSGSLLYGLLLAIAP